MTQGGKLNFELCQSFTESLDALWSCAWSSSGKYLAAGGADRKIRLYTRNEGHGFEGAPSFALTNELTGAHEKSIRYVSFCPGRTRLAAASFDGTVSIWSGTNFNIHQQPQQLKWNCTATLEGHENEVKSVNWFTYLDSEAEQEQTFIATCGRDRTIWLWAADDSFNEKDDDEGDDDFECLAVMQEHEQDVKCLTWHPSLPLFLSGSYDGSIRAWGPIGARSLDDWIPLGKVFSDPNITIWSLAFSPTGDKLAAALSSGKILIFTIPLKSWKTFGEWQRTEITLFPATSLELSGDKRDGCCKEDDISESGSCGGSSESKSKSDCCSADDDRDDKGAVDEDSEDGGCCGGSSEPSESKSGCCQSGSKSKTFEVPPFEIYSVSWNSTGSILAASSSDHSIKLLTESQVITTIPAAHDQEINSVTWSPKNSELLASVGDDGCLKLWKISETLG